MDTEERKFLIERTYRDAFGMCLPSILDFPSEAVFQLGIEALMRGYPVTEEELRSWIANNASSETP